MNMTLCSNSKSSPVMAMALMLFSIAAIYNPSTTGEARAGSPDFSKIFANIAKEASPAVVYIYTKQEVKLSAEEQKLREFYGKVFPFQQEQTPRESLGSGFIMEKEGYILTNSHVVAKADEIMVTLGNGSPLDRLKEYEAKIVSIDAKLDVALIKIEPEEPLPTLAMGDSDALEPGDWVMAIGNPFGFSQSVTVGVVSAKGRIINRDSHSDFIQTDAAINMGNSGGPLLDFNGKVIGINTAIYTGGGYQGNIGISFAIPINVVKAVYDDMKEGKVIKRGLLGVQLQNLTRELAEELGLESPAGALVENVMPDGPADKAGFLPLDVIIEFDGKPVESPVALRIIVENTKPGTPVKVRIIRDGKRKVLRATLIEKPEEAAGGARQGKAPAEKEKPSFGRFGLSVGEITEEDRERLKMDSSVSGVLVTGVEGGSSAQRAGIMADDVIISVERKPVKDPAEFTGIIASVETGSKVLFVILRDGQNTILLMKAED